MYHQRKHGHLVRGAARHRLPVPRLARWMLALGIAASLAVNAAQGLSHGLVGAVVAAWPALALVGSYELLAWMIRTAAGGAGPVPEADQRGTGWLPSPSRVHGVAPVHGAGLDGPDWAGGPVRTAPDHVDAAAVAAYCASIRTGRPLSERKLAEAFGRTSRRWARNRMAEARQSLVAA
jgi:hypothetical protein